MPTFSERFEAACARAARLHAEGRDTTAADADVDRLVAIFRLNSRLDLACIDIELERCDTEALRLVALDLLALAILLEQESEAP